MRFAGNLFLHVRRFQVYISGQPVYNPSIDSPEGRCVKNAGAIACFIDFGILIKLFEEIVSDHPLNGKPKLLSPHFEHLAENLIYSTYEQAE